MLIITKNTKLFFYSLFLIVPFLISIRFIKPEIEEGSEDKYIPSEWFMTQRAASNGDIPYSQYLRAFEQKNKMISLQKTNVLGSWQAAGPSNVGGRITALDVDAQRGIVYAGAAAGGVLRSTDWGVNWKMLTDNFPSLSIGALKLSPENKQIIYCGTGEANINTDSYPGFGMIKSTDGGNTWFKSGMDSVRHIGKIEIHPLNPKQIFVAASGGLYSKGPHRGIYKSNDAGLTWYRTLFLNDSTSAIDVAVDPSDTSRVYAAMWERLRGPTFRKAAGISTAMYLSTNGGWSWTRMSGGLPAPVATTGRISIAVAPSNPNYVYALYKAATATDKSVNNFGSFYKSTDKGTTWTQMPSGILTSFSNFGWYFGLLNVDPLDPLKVYCADVDLFRSTDGGNVWTNITNAYSGTFDQQHPDQHAIWIDPATTGHLFVGNDGGAFESINDGTTWTKKYNLPISQYYASDIDYQNPSHIYGGYQDNGTWGTKTGGLNDWIDLYGGDGFCCKVDYFNSSIIYAEYQNGGIGKSTDGGVSFSSITNGLDLSRSNWSTPYILDPNNPQTLYFGSYKLFKSVNAGSQWTAISGDLSRGVNGRLGTITAISAATHPTNLNSRYLYVGTDDAKLSVSTNDGATWNDRTGTLPRRYISDVIADERNPNIAYVSLSGYNLDEPTPRIFRTTDAGLSWTNISNNLPDAPVNSLIIDYNYDAVIYAGSDIGVFFSMNNGLTWSVLGTGLPNAPVSDLNFHQDSHKLVAATHGRSAFSIDASLVITDVKKSENQTKTFELYQNYPNPFNPGSKISFKTFTESRITAELYDVTGKLVQQLFNDVYTQGMHQYELNGSNLKSGIYFVRLTGNSLVRTIKVVLIK